MPDEEGEGQNSTLWGRSRSPANFQNFPKRVRTPCRREHAQYLSRGSHPSAKGFISYNATPSAWRKPTTGSMGHYWDLLESHLFFPRSNTWSSGSPQGIHANEKYYAIRSNFEPVNIVGYVAVITKCFLIELQSWASMDSANNVTLYLSIVWH